MALLVTWHYILCFIYVQSPHPRPMYHHGSRDFLSPPTPLRPASLWFREDRLAWPWKDFGVTMNEPSTPLSPFRGSSPVEAPSLQ